MPLLRNAARKCPPIAQPCSAMALSHPADPPLHLHQVPQWGSQEEESQCWTLQSTTQNEAVAISKIKEINTFISKIKRLTLRNYT